MAIRTTVRLPESLMRRAKRRAQAEGRSLTALIEDALHRVVNAPQAPRRRNLPPVSSAAGGLQAGIDLSNSAALAELEDRDQLTHR